jgi:hypothetical protein
MEREQHHDPVVVAIEPELPSFQIDNSLKLLAFPESGH